MKFVFIDLNDENKISFINHDHLIDISDDLIMENNKIKLLSANDFNSDKMNLRFFCHKNARYGIVTSELIEFLKKIINGRSAIEIGAGAGDLGFHLGIKMTDSKIQDDPKVKLIYETTKQPTIKYPDDVEKIEALEAVKKYKPQVVIGSWITTYHAEHTVLFNSSPYGIKEYEILNLVETFIIIGNKHIHGKKPILNLKHEIINPPWLLSRKNDGNNCIYIWNKK